MLTAFYYYKVVDIRTIVDKIEISFTKKTEEYYDDEDSLKNTASSSMIISVNVDEKSQVEFYWKVTDGCLKFFVNDVFVEPTKEDDGWVKMSYVLPDKGKYTLKWQYEEGNNNNNNAFVDGLQIKPISATANASHVANTANYAMRSVVATTTTNASLFDSSRITGQFVEDFAIFELLLDDVNAVITSGRFTEYCEEGVITSECDVERIKDSLIITQDNRIILIKISCLFFYRFNINL